MVVGKEVKDASFYKTLSLLTENVRDLLDIVVYYKQRDKQNGIKDDYGNDKIIKLEKDIDKIEEFVENYEKGLLK